MCVYICMCVYVYISLSLDFWGTLGISPLTMKNLTESNPHRPARAAPCKKQAR